MKIGELSKRTGFSVHTLRYYERIGLLPYAHRGRSKQREYDPEVLAWIDFLKRLKTTGMPIRDMLRYAALRDRGAVTGEERMKILIQHREHVLAHVAELKTCLLVLDKKIAGYRGAEQRTRKHDAQSRDAGRKQTGPRPAKARRN